MAIWSGFGIGGTAASVAAAATAVAVSVGGYLALAGRDAPSQDNQAAIAIPDANKGGDAARSEADESRTDTGPARTASPEAGVSPKLDVPPTADTGGQASPPAGEDTSRIAAASDPGARPEADTGSGDAPSIPAPVFDLVRISPDGSAVIAGKSIAGRPVSVVLNGQEIARAEPDKRGNFVALLTLPASTAPGMLTLSVTDDTGAPVESDESVLVSPVTPPQVALADPGTTTPDPGAKPAAGGSAPQADTATPAPATTTGETVVAAAPATGTATPQPAGQGASPASSTPDAGTTAPTTDAPSDDVATTPSTTGDAPVVPPAVVIASDDGVKVLQPAGGAVPAAELVQVTIDAISYDPEGEVVLAGRGRPSGFVRIYVDNQPVKTHPIAADGTWTMTLEEVDAVRYTLRVDEVDGKGKVTSRFETPFQKERPEDVRRVAAAATDAADPATSAPKLSDTGTADTPGEAGTDTAVATATPATSAEGATDTAATATNDAGSTPATPLASTETAAAAVSSEQPSTPAAPTQAPTITAADLGTDQAPAAPRAASAKERPRLTTITVQPGYTLWGLASRKYGSGEMYVRIYTANQSQIRNPDLIYPGQIFTLPD